MHWRPNLRAASRTRPGSLTAEVLSETLSAPAFSIVRMSSTERSPPPTVSGMKTWSAVRSTTSTIVLRPSLEAVMSRKTSSSAPCFS